MKQILFIVLAILWLPGFGLAQSKVKPIVRTQMLVSTDWLPNSKDLRNDKVLTHGALCYHSC